MRAPIYIKFTWKWLISHSKNYWLDVCVTFLDAQILQKSIILPRRPNNFKKLIWKSEFWLLSQKLKMVNSKIGLMKKTYFWLILTYFIRIRRKNSINFFIKLTDYLIYFIDDIVVLSLQGSENKIASLHL